MMCEITPIYLIKIFDYFMNKNGVIKIYWKFKNGIFAFKIFLISD